MDSYHFEYAMDFIEYPLVGDYHASELVFVFDNQWPAIVHDFSAKDKQMAAWFGTYVSDVCTSAARLDSLYVMLCSTPVAAAVVEPGSIRIVSGGGHSVVSLVVALCCGSHV
jgi:hypothetical protein